MINQFIFTQFSSIFMIQFKNCLHYNCSFLSNISDTSQVLWFEFSFFLHSAGELQENISVSHRHFTLWMLYCCFLLVRKMFAQLTSAGIVYLKQKCLDCNVFLFYSTKQVLLSSYSKKNDWILTVSVIWTCLVYFPLQVISNLWLVHACWI